MKSYKKGDIINDVFTVGQFLIKDVNSVFNNTIVIATNFFYKNGEIKGIETTEGRIFTNELIYPIEDNYYITCTHSIHEIRGGGQKAWTYTKTQLKYAQRHYNRLLRQPSLYKNIQINF
jgi:hypothetical protein